ncbi:MAG: hypothetical protein ACI361_09285 [Atopobiaceae bacterium]
MKTYDVDNEYEFEMSDEGLPVLPEGMTRDGELLVLPNGKYLPQGAYALKDGSSLIYEPFELSPFASMLSEGREK